MQTLITFCGLFLICWAIGFYESNESIEHRWEKERTYCILNIIQTEERWEERERIKKQHWMIYKMRFAIHRIALIFITLFRTFNFYNGKSIDSDNKVEKLWWFMRSFARFQVCKIDNQMKTDRRKKNIQKTVNHTDKCPIECIRYDEIRLISQMLTYSKWYSH